MNLDLIHPLTDDLFHLITVRISSPTIMRLLATEGDGGWRLVRANTPDRGVGISGWLTPDTPGPAALQGGLII